MRASGQLQAPPPLPQSTHWIDCVDPSAGLDDVYSSVQLDIKHKSVTVNCMTVHTFVSVAVFSSASKS
jgi:hypothetical protein